MPQYFSKGGPISQPSPHNSRKIGSPHLTCLSKLKENNRCAFTHYLLSHRAGSNQVWKSKGKSG